MTKYPKYFQLLFLELNLKNSSIYYILYKINVTYVL